MKSDEVYLRYVLECIRRVEEDTAGGKAHFLPGCAQGDRSPAEALRPQSRQSRDGNKPRTPLALGLGASARDHLGSRLAPAANGLSGRAEGFRQALRLIDHENRWVAEGAQGVAGRQSRGGSESRLVHLNVKIERDNASPCQDVLDQGRLANLTGAEDNANLVAVEEVPQKLLGLSLEVHDVQYNLSFCTLQ